MKAGTALLMRHHGWLLLALTLVLFATKTLFNVPLWLMAAGGIVIAMRDPRRLWTGELERIVGALFLCLWLPQVLSLVDAVNVPRSAVTVSAYPHFYFATLYAMRTVPGDAWRRWLEPALFLVITAWCLDALVQFFTGSNLLGYPYRPGQLTGMFDPKIRLGHMLAMLAPFYLDCLRRGARGRPWLWLLALPLALVIVLSGKRVAWLMAAVSCGLYLFYLYRTRLLGGRAILAGLLAALLACGIVVSQHAPTARRLESALLLFSGDAAKADRATSHRFPLWAVAVDMASVHWFNGVGPRGYRYDYVHHAAADNFYLRGGRSGQTHPHQMLLEVAAETGVVGVAGLVLFWWLLVRTIRRAAASARAPPGLLPAALSTVAAWLPFNAHLAFYGSYWSSVGWWMIALLAAGCAAAMTPAGRS